MTAEMTSLPTISDVRLCALPKFQDPNGDLIVMQGATHVPFDFARLFVVRAPEGAVRGQHAHRRCTQFLSCPAGEVRVVCTDGTASADFVLDRPEVGLLVPAGIWSEQTYLRSDSVLIVVCDEVYDPDDYIRRYDDFVSYRRIPRQP